MHFIIYNQYLITNWCLSFWIVTPWSLFPVHIANGFLYYLLQPVDSGAEEIHLYMKECAEITSFSLSSSLTSSSVCSDQTHHLPVLQISCKYFCQCHCACHRGARYPSWVSTVQYQCHILYSSSILHSEILMFAISVNSVLHFSLIQQWISLENAVSEKKLFLFFLLWTNSKTLQWFLMFEIFSHTVLETFVTVLSHPVMSEQQTTNLPLEQQKHQPTNQIYYIIL